MGAIIIKTSSLILPAIVIGLIASVFLVIGHIHAQQGYHEKKMLDRAINNANDAALLDATSTLRSDEYGVVSIDADFTWETYKRVLLKGMGSYNKMNMDLLEGMCPATLIAVDDGMYIKMQSENTSLDIIETKFTQKIPYARMNNAGNLYIADTITGKFIKTVTEDGYVELLGDATPVPDDNDIHSTTAVKLQILNAFQYMLDMHTASSSSMTESRSLIIGPEASRKVNNIKNSLLMNVIVDYNIGVTYPISELSISTTQLTKPRYVFCFDLEGDMYYAQVFSVTELPANAENIHRALSTKEAVDNGYSPYLNIELN